jgi:hypothetical protein
LNDVSDLTEERMRAALHLPHSSSSPSPIAHRGRHRFVQDGEVPVVVVNPRPQRPEEDRPALAALERALVAEREARQAAEKALQQAAETIRQLQTRLAHAEIAQREAAAAPAVAPETPTAEKVRPPKKLRSRDRKPAEDKPVEWWKPGWQERSRNQQRWEGLLASMLGYFGVGDHARWMAASGLLTEFGRLPVEDGASAARLMAAARSSAPPHDGVGGLEHLGRAAQVIELWPKLGDGVIRRRSALACWWPRRHWW